MLGRGDLGGAAGEALAQVVVGGLGTGLLLFCQELNVFIDRRGLGHTFGSGKHHGAVEVELSGKLFEGGQGSGHAHVLLQLGKADKGGHKSGGVGGVVE